MTKKELKRVEYLLGFVNSISDMVSNPDEYMNPSCKSASILEVGCSINENNETIVSALDGDDTLTDLKSVLRELEILVSGYLKVNYTDKWNEIRG